MRTGVSSSLKIALAGRHGRLQDVVLLREVGDRLVEALRVLEERDQRADGERAAGSPAPPPYQTISAMPIVSISSMTG